MSKKIAAVDNSAMNELYKADFARTAASVGVKDQNGAPESESAFEDHAEYLDTLESVLKEDNKNSFEPNEVTAD